MHIFKQIFLLQMFSVLTFGSNLVAQDKVQIIGTDLKIVLKEGYILDANSAVITTPEYGISFMEMSGVKFSEEIEDFNDIEEKYALKGIVVKENKKGKVREYEAQFITLESNPPIYQVIFGNDDFLAMVNVIGADSMSHIDKGEIDAILSTVEYEKNEESALDIHANFIIDDENNEWNFLSHAMSIFAFEHTNAKDGLMISQLPPMTLFFSSKEDLAHEFLNKVKSNMPNLEIIEEGSWQAKNIEGHRILVDVGQEENSHVELIYMFVFSSEKSAFVLQGLGKKNDLSTKQLYDSLLDKLELKK